MDFFQLKQKISSFQNYMSVESIGKSVLGQEIFCISKIFDTKFKWALITGGIHAREHLSCDLVVWLIELCKNQNFQFNLAFVPLVNPDGANLCLHGISLLPPKSQKQLEKINGSGDFSLFKANANGVDLNNNFDANWSQQFSNVKKPSSSGFYGYRPFSEPETVALKTLASRLDLFFSVSFHLKGEQIYYDFFQGGKRRERDQKIAQIFAQSTGYEIVETQKTSSGGFKDWCVSTLKIPSLTIELGSDKFSHPFPQSQFPQICKKNQDFFVCLRKSWQIFNSYGNVKF